MAFPPSLTLYVSQSKRCGIDLPTVSLEQDAVENRYIFIVTELAIMGRFLCPSAVGTLMVTDTGSVQTRTSFNMKTLLG